MLFTKFIYTSLLTLSIMPYTIQYPPTLQCARSLILSLFQSYLFFSISDVRTSVICNNSDFPTG